MSASKAEAPLNFPNYEGGGRISGYSAYEARAELDALLPDIEAALEILDDDAMPQEQPFSKRHRYRGAKEITTRSWMA